MRANQLGEDAYINIKKLLQNDDNTILRNSSKKQLDEIYKFIHGSYPCRSIKTKQDVLNGIREFIYMRKRSEAIKKIVVNGRNLNGGLSNK